ncbi:MAG: hypothetical protein GX592_06710 [Clostridiales bacterium]|nr:hypothetical protein [Clostridiales bacterium]
MLKAGFARLPIAPPLGIFLTGYYEPRVAKGTLDPLFASATAFSDGENKCVLLCLDIIGIRQATLDGMRGRIGANVGLPRAAVFVTCTHTHTGPEVDDGMFEPDPVYNARLEKLMEQAAQAALDDLQGAHILAADGRVEGISFIRRFRMRDGSTRTNPGYANPDIVAPIGEPDHELRIARIVREGADEILLVNFQVHPDTIGDCMGSVELFSADYPGFVVRALEGALPGVKAVYLNGAAGNLNHVDVFKPDWDPNGGYGHTAHMGRKIAGEALSIYTKARPLPSDRGVRFAEMQLPAPANKARPEQLPLAQNYVEWHRAGRDDMIPETGMGITTLVAEATRMLALRDAPDDFLLNMTALSAGGLCLAGIPGEAFTEVGQHIKGHSPFPQQMVLGISNGYEGYFPTREAYEEGGYEARSSSFKGGVAEGVAGAEAELVRRLWEG